MSDDESILTPTERLAASALRAALHDESADQPLRMDVAGWIEGAPRKRPNPKGVPVALAAVLALVLVVGLVAWPRVGGVVPGAGGESPSAGPPSAGPPSAGPSLPGTPGHFDDGQMSFDYPTDWPTIAGGFSSGGVEYVLAVLGDGTWREGCVYGENSISCGPDTFDVPPGGILVKVYRWWGGPAVPCRGDVQANATFGDLAVRKTVDGTATTWEIRVPGNEFGQNNNIFVEVHTGSPSQLARAEALVASFRWAPGESNVGDCAPIETPTPSPSLARYHADGISFDYPASWPVISGFQHFGLNGPTVRFAIGTGIANSGCQPIATSSTIAGGIDCPAGPTIAATGDQVVVMWYGGAGLGDPPLLPTGSLSPGQTRVTIGGMPAIESYGDGWIKWQLSLFGYIEAQWGPDATNAEAEVDALVASLSLGS
jgi:hypothetical protein